MFCISQLAGVLIDPWYCLSVLSKLRQSGMQISIGQPHTGFEESDNGNVEQGHIKGQHFVELFQLGLLK